MLQVFVPFVPFARGQAHTVTGSFLGLMIAFRANTVAAVLLVVGQLGY